MDGLERHRGFQARSVIEWGVSAVLESPCGFERASRRSGCHCGRERVWEAECVVNVMLTEWIVEF